MIPIRAKKELMNQTQPSGNGVLSSLFGRGTSATPAKESKPDVSSKVVGADLSPEAVVTSPNFTLVDGVLNGAVEVTPSIAELWLERNKNIRKFQASKINLFKQCMLDGKWDYNGETIKFNAEGNLVDGQNRLKACIEAGRSFRTSVVYGIESADNVDRGKPRSVGQLIQSLGIAYDSNIASAMTNFLFAYKITGEKSFSKPGLEAKQLTLDDAVEFVRDNITDLNHSMSVTWRAKMLFNKCSLHAALHYLFSKTAGVALADEFYGGLISGTGLNANSPIYLLRERLLKIRSSGSQPNINPYAGLIIKAWNAFITGKPLTSLRFKYELEGMPKILRSPVRQG